MRENNEVTLKIKGNIEKLKKMLEEKGYKEKGHFVLYDTFMVPSNLSFESMSVREIISKAIIIRKVDDIAKNEVRRDISYKIKKINDNDEILEQKSIRLKIFNCEEAERFMEAIGYKKIMNIVEEDYNYEKDGFTLTTKDLKDGDKMIEVETQIDNEAFDTIEKIKAKLKKENIPLDFSNCFIKKAEVELNKILSSRRKVE